MKAIFTDYNFFGKKIIDVDTIEITGEPTSDRHVITRQRGELLKSEAIQQARLEIIEATKDLLTKSQVDDLTRSQTHYFINESLLSYDWIDPLDRPIVDIFVLDTSQTINNSSVTVTDNDTHKYSGTYNSVGSQEIDEDGLWTVISTYHNLYKHVSQPYYVVFNQANHSWQIIEEANPHTSVGTQAASFTVVLGGASSLPESFGSYIIDPNFDNIDSLEFSSADANIQYDDNNSRVLISFGSAKPSGYVVLK